MVSWSRIADRAQQTVSLSLFGLTMIGLVMLGRGGYGIIQRRKERKALEATEQTAKADDSNNSPTQ